MLETIIAALLLIHPHPSKDHKPLAKIIVAESARAAVDPLLVVALIHYESRFNPKAKSGRGDFGLMQVRARAVPKFRRNPNALLDPRVNISAGVDVLAYWRSFHRSQCGKRPKHDWWSHYQWGLRVGNNRSAARVERLRRRLAKQTERRSVACITEQESLSSAFWAQLDLARTWWPISSPRETSPRSHSAIQ